MQNPYIGQGTGMRQVSQGLGNYGNNPPYNAGYQTQSYDAPGLKPLAGPPQAQHGQSMAHGQRFFDGGLGSAQSFSGPPPLLPPRQMQQPVPHMQGQPLPHQSMPNQVTNMAPQRASVPGQPQYQQHPQGMGQDVHSYPPGPGQSPMQRPNIPPHLQQQQHLDPQQQMPPHLNMPPAKRMQMDNSQQQINPVPSQQSLKSPPMQLQQQKGPDNWRRQALLLELASLDKERHGTEETRKSYLQRFQTAVGDEATKDEDRRNMLNRLEGIRTEMEENDQKEVRLKAELNQVQREQVRLQEEALRLHATMRDVHNDVCGIQETRSELIRHMNAGLDSQRALEQRCYRLLCELWALPAPNSGA